VLEKKHRVIRVLEVEAEMYEKDAKRLAESASYVGAPDHKHKLEALSAEAQEKAAAIRSRIQQMQSALRN
jgi:hypothetical protein